MQKRRLGQTDIWVSVLGLGTVKFGRTRGLKYPATFELPTDAALINLLACAKAFGINLLDTAPAYGMSEERIGKLLGSDRQAWVICTKVGETFLGEQSSFDFSSEAINASIDRSLKRLKTDYLDIVLVHSNGNDDAIIREDEAFETLEALKKAGKIRSYGMSTKTIEGGLATVDAADVAMISYNPLYTAERAVIKTAEQKQKGIFIKKALASGHLHQFQSKDPVSEIMRFIFQEPGVTSVIVGTIDPMHLQQNVESAERVIQVIVD